MRSETDVIVVGAGQSGLAAARALQACGIRPVLLEAGPEPVGSWPRYYDNLTLFSPADYSSMPGLEFPGHPDRYPDRDEVVAYLRRYAASLDADIRNSTTVSAVQADGQTGFLVHAATGQTWHAVGIVAATGLFGNPYLPTLPGQEQFAGRLQHVASYRSPQIGGLAPAAPQDQDGDTDHHCAGCGADHYGVDLAKARADPVYGALGTLLRAHPVGYGVDGVRQLVAGAVDVRHQCVLIDGLRFEVRVSHYVLRFRLG